MLRLLELAAIAVVATVVVWKGSGWLEAASQNLSAQYGLPPAVQGAVLGSAVFNLLVIPAVSGIVGDEVSTSRAIVYREARFYVREPTIDAIPSVGGAR